MSPTAGWIMGCLLLISFPGTSSNAAGENPPPPPYHHHQHPPSPIYYRSPPPPSPPHHYHHRHRSQPPPSPPEHSHRHPPSPPEHSHRHPPFNHPPLPPSFGKAPPPSPCYEYLPLPPASPPQEPLKPPFRRHPKIVVEGKVVCHGAGFAGARIKVECHTPSGDARASFGYSNAAGEFKLMVSGLELGTLEIKECEASIVKTPQSSCDTLSNPRAGKNLLLNSVTSKEIKLRVKPFVLY